MRMVSNRHLTSSVKRFKRVHVQHKAYIAKPISTVETSVPDKEVAKEEEKVTVRETADESTPKKSNRRKKAAEDIENNEENTESHEQ